VPVRLQASRTLEAFRACCEIHHRVSETEVRYVQRGFPPNLRKRDIPSGSSQEQTTPGDEGAMIPAPRGVVELLSNPSSVYLSGDTLLICIPEGDFCLSGDSCPK